MSFFLNKLLQIRRDLVESFPRHILFFNDSNSKVPKKTSNVSDESEKAVTSMIFGDIRMVFDEIMCRICPRRDFFWFDYSLWGLEKNASDLHVNESNGMCYETTGPLFGFSIIFFQKMHFCVVGNGGGPPSATLGLGILWVSHTNMHFLRKYDRKSKKWLRGFITHHITFI